MRYNYKDKLSNIRQLNKYMLAKTLGMFEYKNLPETIPASELEKIIQRHGFAYITEVEGDLYAFHCTKGGEQDVYGNPQEVVIANTFLKFNKTLNIKNDGVLIANDSMELGVLPLYEKHHTLMVENDINMIIWGYNSRSQKLISAPDDKTQTSAENYIKKLIDGDISVIGENALFDGVRVQAAATSTAATVTSMIEFQQYQKAALYNEMGLSANFNMKRERLVSGEIDNQDDSLFPFVYNMLKCRKEAVERINEKYGLEIEVDFGSVWKIKQVEIEAEVKAAEASESEAPVASTETTETSTSTEQQSETTEATESDTEALVEPVEAANEEPTDDSSLPDDEPEPVSEEPEHLDRD